MRRLDELFTQWPFLGSRRDRRPGAAPAHDASGAGSQDLPLLAARVGYRPAESGLGSGHHLPAHRPGLSVFGGSHRLGEPGGAELAAEQHHGQLEEALARFGRPEISNTDQGSQFTSAAFTELLIRAGVRISMDGRGRWMTTCSSSGCGGR